MSYRVSITKDIRDQIRNLPGNIKAIAKQHIIALGENPRPAQSKELSGHSNYYRIWLTARYRLVWHVIDEEQLVELDYVGPKTPDLYAYLGLGRQND